MAPRGVSTWRRPYTSIYNDNYRYGTGLYSDTLTDIEKRYSESISKTHLRSDRPDLTFSTFSGSNLLSSPAPAEDSSSARETTRFSRQLSVSPTREYTRSPNFESRLNATLKSAAFELDEDVEDAINKRIEARKQALARSQSEIHSSKTEDEEDEEFRVRLERRKRALAKFQESRAESEEFATKLKKSTTTTSVREEEPLRPTSLYDDAALWTLPKSMDKISDIPKSRKKAGGRQTPTNGPSSQWRDKR